MASLVITNATANNVIITGDNGVPRVNISPSTGTNTATVAMSQVVGNVQFCNELAAYITAGTVTAAIGSTTQSAARITAYRDGDMSAAIYDTNADGVVDGSADSAAVALNTTHRSSDGTDHANVVLNDTHRASDGTDHANVVLNDTHRASDGTDHANVVLADTHRGSDGTDHANVVLADTHRGSDGTDHANVVLNDTHRASDGTDHANVVLADTHRGSDGTDHANVVLNDTHRASAGLDHSYLADNLVQVVITAVGGSGGAAGGTISVQVNDLGGTAITRAVNIRLDISDTDMAGDLDPATNATFVAATTGTIIAGAGGTTMYVTTDATGLFEGTTNDAVDETVYFSAATHPGGFAALANSCVVAQCATDSATWSA